jgi:hypothetical protein
MTVLVLTVVVAPSTTPDLLVAKLSPNAFRAGRSLQLQHLSDIDLLAQPEAGERRSGCQVTEGSGR